MPHTIRLELSDKDQDTLMHGSLGDAIRVVRWQVHMGLVECKNLVERIRCGEFVVERGKPKKRCPNCGGSGFVEDKEMPTTGSYEFKLSEKAENGLVENATVLQPGEWGWSRHAPKGDQHLMLIACCPDCKHLMTIFRQFADNPPDGHTIDANGMVKPSILHKYPVDGVETCGFHSSPTKLLSFVDLRSGQ